MNNIPTVVWLISGLVLGFIFGFIVSRMNPFGVVHILKNPSDGETGFLFEFNDVPSKMMERSSVRFDVSLEDSFSFGSQKIQFPK